MKQIKIAGIIRKSPASKEDRENSIQMQRKAIERRVDRDFMDDPLADPRIVWFVDDGVSGDSPDRPQLMELFKTIDTFEYAYVRDVDRFSRSYLGLMWFHQYFITERGMKPHKGCKLRFCSGVSKLYDKNNLLNTDNYLMFFFLCGIAQGELIKSRQRCEAGRERLRGTPEWKKKYQGRRKSK